MNRQETKNFACDIEKDLIIALELILVKKQMSKRKWLTERIKDYIKKEPN